MSAPATRKELQMTHPMRRTDKEISSPEEIDALLSSGKFVTIGLSDGAHPYVVTLSYGFDSETRRLYSHAASAGRKLDVCAANPAACGTVIRDLGYVADECTHHYESVVVYGRLRLVDDVDEERHGMQVLMRQLEADPVATWAGNDLDDPATWQRFRMLAFDIEHATGKRGI
jgi:nitroimidazol reductase NimA-like FMN-containing flavoprotein (pyridoxamine 5'-phosphate oxidase superfamily)